MTNVTQIKAQDFTQAVVEHDGIVLVDFFAEWCGPCKMVAPILEQLSNERDDVKIVKVDADEAPDLMAQFGIRGIPTLLLFKQGEKVGSKVGAVSLSQLQSFVSQASA